MELALSTSGATRSSQVATTREPSAQIRFTIDGRPGIRRGEPITMGVPLHKGSCTDPCMLSIAGPEGRPLPLQVRVLDQWADGSIRWALLDFQADVCSSEDVLALSVGSTPIAIAPPLPIVCRAIDQGMEIDTGAAVFTLQTGSAHLFREIAVGGTRVIDPARTGFVVERAGGDACTVAFDSLTLEETGPLRSVVLARGRVVARDAAHLVDIDVRLHWYAGSATVRVAATVRNPRPAAHAGGFWELGDPGSVLLHDLAFTVAVPETEGHEYWCSPELGQAGTPVAIPFELYQESSGGENWRHPNHRNSRGIVPLRLRGYRVRAGTSERTGDRASPIVGLLSGNSNLAMTLPLFWQNFPKAIEVSRGGMALRLFPRQLDDPHELQGGEQKTHTFYVAFDTDRVTESPLDWCRSPLLASLPPEWYCSTRAMPRLVPRAADADADYHALIDAALDPVRGFVPKRETIDEYGWRNFGDLYADHEAAFHPPGAQVVSHYNNQYDAVAGFCAQFMRTGDSRWWRLMDDLARHVADIDIYRTAGDKAAYNNGLFWHTYHYVDAGLSTHRSYPRLPKVSGGGLSNEHNYATGLMLHHFLTGDPISREAAVGLARWVVDMDDGRRTIFRWLARTPTGLASNTASTEYHGPGRGSAYSVASLLDGHRLTGDSSLIVKADELIRRVIHPADDLPARNLLDAERRWSYTVFLQVLGRYLEEKAERGELDAMYEYARASLLHYARWMVVHEYPYLDKPDILEYPTETWAAQDLRKSDVLYCAACYTTGPERERFLARAAFFFDTSVGTLARMEMRTLARPLVLLLLNGAWHAWMRTENGGDPARPIQGHAEFGLPRRFVPQKQKAKRRLIALAGAGLLLFGAGILGLAVRWFAL